MEPSVGIAFEMQNQNDKLYGFGAELVREIQIAVPGTFRSLSAAVDEGVNRQ